MTRRETVCPGKPTGKQSGPRLTARQQEYLRLFRAGLWPAEVAARLGVTSTAVSLMTAKLIEGGWIGDDEVRRVDRGHQGHTHDVYLRELRTGRTQSEIARRLGVSRQCVYFYRRLLQGQGLLP